MKELRVSLYTQGITSHTLIYDLESISNTNSMADIFRSFPYKWLIA